MEKMLDFISLLLGFGIGFATSIVILIIYIKSRMTNTMKQLNAVLNLEGDENNDR